MFGLGWGEVVVIGIVALIAIGPKELPTVLRSLGQWMGKIRRMAAEFQGQFQEALREAELSDLKKHAEDITSDITNFDPMADTRKEMEKAFEMPDPMKNPDALASTDTASAAPSAEPATPLPAIDVPMPELPPPVTEQDFTPAEPPPAAETPKEKPKRKKKQAGGSA
jgi:sec-independent protein translocase protein TatB